MVFGNGPSVLALFLPLMLVVRADEEAVSVNKAVNRSPRPWKQQQQPMFSSDYVRCFCNLPRCVTTGYMCKSRGGGCYSDLGAPSGSPSPFAASANLPGRHGCLESETETAQQPRCQNGKEDSTVAAARGQQAGRGRSLLFCCYHDMCNHVDSPQARNLFNSTLLGDIVDRIPQQKQHRQEQETFLCSRSEVWFRAATIAVPICGAVILFALIVLAIKLLKSENQESFINHKLGPTMYVHQVSPKNSQEKCYNHYDGQYDNLLRKSYYSSHHQNTLFSDHNDEYSNHYQMPLLIQNDAQIPKNEIRCKIAKSNLIQGCDINAEKPIILEIEKEPADCSSVNIVTNHDKFCNMDSTKVHKDNTPL